MCVCIYLTLSDCGFWVKSCLYIRLPNKSKKENPKTRKIELKMIHPLSLKILSMKNQDLVPTLLVNLLLKDSVLTIHFRPTLSMPSILFSFSLISSVPFFNI